MFLRIRSMRKFIDEAPSEHIRLSSFLISIVFPYRRENYNIQKKLHRNPFIILV